MRLCTASFVLALICGFGLADAARAQSLEQSLTQCTGGDVDTIIAGCTGLINSSQVDRRNKAVAYVTRGNAYARQGDWDRAIADFTDAIRRNSRSLAALYNRGNAHIVQEIFDQALVDFSRAISLQPDHAPSYAGRGNAYLGKGQTAQAIAEYDKALELDPNNAQAAANRALAYTKDGDIGGVFRNFGAVIKVFFRSLFGGR